MQANIKLRALIAVLCLLGSFEAKAQAAPTQVTIEQGRAMAVAAHQAHDAPMARALAEALLQRDPNDVLALQILAAASYAMGDFATAQSSGKRAFRLAKAKPERHDSARIVAEALFKQNHLQAARLWLRRASDLAPDAATRTNDIRAFQGIGQRMPLKLTFEGAIAPSNNVNGGSSTRKPFFAGYFPGTSTEVFSVAPLPLSGVTTNLSFGAEYRIKEDQTHRTTLSFGLSSRFNRLSSSAKAKVPGAEGSDYDFVSTNATLGHSFLTTGASGPTDLTATIGAYWYGGEPLADYIRFGGARSFASKDGRKRLTLFGSAEHQARQDRTLRNSDTLFVGVDAMRLLSNGNILSVRFSLSDSRSRSTDIDNQMMTVSTSYTTANLLPGVKLSGDFEIFQRQYKPTDQVPSGRHDQGASLSLSMTFTEKRYLGMSPEVSLSASHTASTNDLYDRRDLGVSFGLKSAF